MPRGTTKRLSYITYITNLYINYILAISVKCPINPSTSVASIYEFGKSFQSLIVLGKNFLICCGQITMDNEVMAMILSG